MSKNINDNNETTITNLLLIGRWHGVTRDQQKALRRSVEEAGPGKLVFVITAADQAGTKRHPLKVEERRQIVIALAGEFGRPYEVHAVVDIKESDRWVQHLREVVLAESSGATSLDPANTVVLSANHDVIGLFQQAGYPTNSPHFEGAMPADMLATISTGGDWRQLATEATRQVFEANGVGERVQGLFADVLLTEDGELSTGRDFSIYIKGMDAGMALKVSDMAPSVRPGRIVDKGCGSGTLLVHLSNLHPTSEIIGMDLSRELLRAAEGQHYPSHNVSVVRGNIIHQRFPAASVDTTIFSSVMHEVFSYNGYDRDLVRLALRNTRTETKPHGRIIIRDGVAPSAGTVYMRCDAESEQRFLKFAHDFKGMSSQPGVKFAERVLGGQTWFILDLHDANEFLSKKDYLENWDIEVNEEFGVFTVDQWRDELEAAGFRILEARAYVNPWILDNRYQGRVWLHASGIDGPGTQLAFPDTTIVVVGEAL